MGSEGEAQGFVARDHLVSYLLLSSADKAQRLAEKLSAVPGLVPSPKAPKPETRDTRGATIGAPIEDLYRREPQSPAQRFKAQKAQRQGASEEDLAEMLGGLGDLLGDAQPTASDPGSVVALEKEGLRVSFKLLEVKTHDETGQGRITTMEASFTNSSAAPFTNFAFAAAPPQGARIQMQTASGAVVAPHGQGAVTQTMRVVRAPGTALRLMMRFKFERGGEAVA